MFYFLLLLISFVFSQNKEIDCTCDNTSTELCLNAGTYTLKIERAFNGANDAMPSSLFLNICTKEKSNRIEIENDHNLLSFDFAISKDGDKLCYVYTTNYATNNVFYTYSSNYKDAKNKLIKGVSLKNLLTAEKLIGSSYDPNKLFLVYEINSLDSDCNFSYVKPDSYTKPYVNGNFLKLKAKI